MLEGLDKINWRRLSTSYGSAKDAPHYLRAFLSPHEQDRKNAAEYMYGAVNHQGHIHDSTAAVTPFLIELLANEATPDREEILGILYAFAESIEEASGYRGMTFLSTLTELYSNLKSGILLYERFLRHPNLETRKLAVRLVGLMRNYSPRTRLRLWKAFKQETDSLIKEKIIDSLIDSLPNDWNINYTLLRVYRQKFEGLTQSDLDRYVKGAAAFGWIYCEVHMLTFKGKLGHIPVSILTGLINSLDEYDYLLETYSKKRYILFLVFEDLLEVFSKTDLSAFNLHLVAHELLRQSFSVTKKLHDLTYDVDRWQDFYRYNMQDKTITYSIISNPHAEKRNLDLHSPIPANIKKRAVLQAIIDQDRFWELKTNLFSFFFGLPDDRDELRKLLHSNHLSL